MVVPQSAPKPSHYGSGLGLGDGTVAEAGKDLQMCRRWYGKLLANVPI